MARKMTGEESGQVSVGMENIVQVVCLLLLGVRRERRRSV
jgi:hypothetical protein